MSLRLTYALAVAIGISGWCWPSDARAQPAEDPQSAALTASISAMERGDCKFVIKTTTDLIQPAFDPAKDNIVRRAAALGLRATCKTQNGDDSAALRDATASTELANIAPQFWWLRVSLARKLGKPNETVTAIEAMAERSPAALTSLADREVLAVVNSLRGLPDRTLYSRLLEVMTRPGYHPDDILVSADWHLYEYARVKLKAGDKAAAARLMARMSDPETQQWVSLESDLRTYFPADFDFARPVEASITALREYAKQHPTQIGPVLKIAQHLRRLNKAADAVAVLQPVEPSKRSQPFADGRKYASDWWEELARSYRMLGRYKDAVGAYRAEIAWLGSDSSAYNAWVNLAHTQLQYGLFADAIQSVKSVEKLKSSMPPSALLEARSVRACAFTQLGKGHEAKSDFGYMAAHQAENRGYVIRSMLCASDLDGAAKVAVQMLGDPYNSAIALQMFSNYEAPLAIRRPYPGEDKIAQLAAHPVVQKAINAAGGTRRFNVQAPEF